MKQYVQLNKSYRLRKEGNRAIIFNIEIENMLNYFKFIPLEHFGLLMLCNGQFTVEQLINIYCDVLKIEYDKGKNDINYFFEQYDSYIEFTDVLNTRDDIIVESNEYVINQRKYKSEHRLLSPLLISMVVTYDCSCYCNYCFVGANNTNKSLNYMTTEQIIRLIREFKSIGVSAINITGGDPFTRSDIFDIIKECVDCNIDFNISTKVLLSHEQIQKLITTGIKKIQISLDSIYNSETKILINIESYATRMLDVINMLINAGIKVNVNSVVTSVNVNSIEALVKELDNTGVDTLFITPYLRTLGRHNNSLFPSYEDYTNLTEFINSYEGKIFINYKEPKIIYEDKSLNSKTRCSGGRMGLVINPNGDVTICERLIDYKECIVGNIKNNSIMEIWNGDKLANLIEPNKEKFKTSKCFKCEEFDKCVFDEGLCYARCLIYHKNMWDSDPLCKKENNLLRFV